MKKYYHLFLLFISISAIGQTSCDEANYYIVSSYSHVKDSYESNNIDHLKYYADRAVKSLELFKEKLKNCDCPKAEDLAQKSYDMLVKVDYQETYEDGRFFVSRSKELIKESVIEDDKCLAGKTNTSSYDFENTPSENSENKDDLSDLRQEQLNLKQQQEALNRKEKEIKAKLAAQKQKEQTLEKQQLITAYENALTLNVKRYNETLKVCNCSHKTLTYDQSSELSDNSSTSAIKTYYIAELKTLASNYLDELNKCQ